MQTLIRVLLYCLQNMSILGSSMVRVKGGKGLQGLIILYTLNFVWLQCYEFQAFKRVKFHPSYHLIHLLLKLIVCTEALTGHTPWNVLNSCKITKFKSWETSLNSWKTSLNSWENQPYILRSQSLLKTHLMFYWGGGWYFKSGVGYFNSCKSETGPFFINPYFK